MSKSPERKGVESLIAGLGLTPDQFDPNALEAAEQHIRSKRVQNSNKDPILNNIVDVLDEHDSPNQRMCAFIPADAYVEGEGYRVSFVKEGVAGHFPTGHWPYDPRKPKPWFWGPSYEEACEAADEYNANIGISKQDQIKIVASSIGAQRRGEDT